MACIESFAVYLKLNKQIKMPLGSNKVMNMSA